MNPQERAVIDGIFERLRSVANQPRDAEVERYIADLIRQQPYAPYAMAQSVYVQEQALINQQREIEQLQAEVQQLQQAQAQQPAPQSGGFLSGLFGGGAQQPQRPEPAYGQRGQQPSHAMNAQPMPAQSPAAGPWGGQQQPAAAAPQRQGMGFLGTAAAAAAGVAGGMMVGSLLSNAFGGGGQAHAGQGGLGSSGQNNNAQNQTGQDSQGLSPEVQDDGYDDAGDDGYDDGGSDSYEA